MFKQYFFFFLLEYTKSFQTRFFHCLQVIWRIKIASPLSYCLTSPLTFSYIFWRHKVRVLYTYTPHSIKDKLTDRPRPCFSTPVFSVRPILCLLSCCYCPVILCLCGTSGDFPRSQHRPDVGRCSVRSGCWTQSPPLWPQSQRKKTTENRQP